MSEFALRHRSKRALLLLSVLFFTVLIAMFVTAAVAFAPSGFARSETDRSLQLADSAARSGLEWARMRISSNPHWIAADYKPFDSANLYVVENAGQVTGWVRQGNDWARFRLRFNYQDGAARPDLASDGLGNPPSLWEDFPYVCCNNLRTGSDRPVPVAQAGGSMSSAGNWGNTQLTLPRNTLLLSCEGSSGSHLTTDSSGHPTGFTGGFRHRTVQSVLRFGSTLPTTDAALMSAGDVQVITGDDSPTELKSSPANETARIRSKGNLQAYPGVHSPKGDLRFTDAASNAGELTGDVSTSTELAADPFYQIPESKLRSLLSPIHLPAGVYVVDAEGHVTRFNQNYKDYSETPATGESVTFPAGMSLVKKDDGADGPLWRLKVNRDVQVTESSGVNDFALIPDGGAPQSRDYGGVAKRSSIAALSTGDVTRVQSLLPVGQNTLDDLTPEQFSAWQTALSAVAQTTEVREDGGSDDRIEYQIAVAGGGTATVTMRGDRLQVNGGEGGLDVVRQALVNHADDAVMLASANAVTGLEALSLSDESSTLTSSSKLHPDDLQLNLNGDGTDGLMFRGPGNLVFASQVLGKGGSLVSEGDVRFIGTSTELSSDPEVGLGLNCYAKNDFIVDSYQVRSPGRTAFGKVDLTGVVYAWHNISIFAGSGRAGQDFTLKGAMVAYGGDPADQPHVNQGSTSIQAKTVSVTYDPSYVATLMSNGPFMLQTMSWHEF